ncbi:MAG: radical SAM protein [Proteobacteria bacterium]|nr:radical SAM protein [Pseudomonadota bacterium]
MKIVLIFPPLADPTQPCLSLPALTAFLKNRNWHEIIQLDANIEFVRYVLTRERLQIAWEKIKSGLMRFDGKPALKGTDAAKYTLLASAFLKAPIVVAGIDTAVNDLKNPEVFRDLKRFNHSKRLFQEAMEILSATCFPLNLSFSNSSGSHFTTPSEITKWARDTEVNLFRDFLQNDTLPKLRKAYPTAIGISITYRSQVLPAITLALLVRDQLPGIPVIFGGNMVSYWYDSLKDCPEIFEWCDYLIPFEGESALDGLLSAIEDGRALKNVPNLVYLEHGRIRKNPVILEEINSLPTPDYRGLPLDIYFSPQTVFLLYTSRGCYWSQCNFCSVSPSMRFRCRVRHPDLIHRDMVTLSTRHGAKCISFADDCVAPATLKALASRLRKKGPEVSWQCEVRFEKALKADVLSEIREVGCLNLIFGLESYDPRVLTLMNKGIRHDQIERILVDCRRIGIAFNLQFFFGFPGETADEAEITLDFVKRHIHGAASFSFGTFELQKGAKVEREPGAFGIQRVERNCGPLAVKFDYSSVPSHAKEMRARLRREILARTRYRYVALSINAHTLVFLHESGVSAMAKIYRDAVQDVKARTPVDRLIDCTLVPSANQNVGIFAHSLTDLLKEKPAGDTKNGSKILIYDHDLDKTIEVSRLALWILQNLDGTRTPSELVALLTDKIEGVTTAHVLATIREVVKDLYGRGFLVQVRK